MRKRICTTRIRTDVFYGLIEPICMRESGGQSANSSTARKHLRRAGPVVRSTLRNTVNAPLSCCRERRSAADCCRFHSRPEGHSPEGCSPRDTPLPGILFPALPCPVAPGWFFFFDRRLLRAAGKPVDETREFIKQPLQTVRYVWMYARGHARACTNVWLRTQHAGINLGWMIERSLNELIATNFRSRDRWDLPFVELNKIRRSVYKI